MSLGRLVFLGFSSAVFLLAVLAPAAGPYSGAVYALFSGFCHQLPERSLFLFGGRMAVCARCAGIYAGMVLGSAAFPALNVGKRPPRGLFLLAASMPMVVDGLGQFLGLWGGFSLLRLATGLVFGFALPMYLIPALDIVLARFGLCAKF
jgi:uncharacterized membrane protein